MNLFSHIFLKVYSTKLDEICKENNSDLLLLHDDLINLAGKDVSDEILKEISLKRLLECYTTKEILEILRYYKVI